MRLHITDSLRINLASERWECRACGQALGSARHSYKTGLLMHVGQPEPRAGEPASPHPPLCLLYEFFCPGCGTRIEAELQAPGHLPSHDIELDIDALKRQWGAGPAEFRGPQGVPP
jgi:acetone carboxylase, gamma subunit